MTETIAKTQQQRLIIVVLMAIFVINVWYTHSKRARQGSASREGVVKGAVAATLTPLTKAKVTYDVMSFRDPLEKPMEFAIIEGKISGKTVLPQSAALTLEGVIWGGDKNMAIISGQVIQEGDSLGSAKVKKITKDKVVLVDNGREIEIKR
ncbi:MAG: hypothetical protein PHS37_00310 [Candidatus Omnitrophica bacterium]|nr:hypothetical protein [Candidatus Omnitrophota bacterium]